MLYDRMYGELRCAHTLRKLQEGLYLRTKNHEMIPLDTYLFAKKLTDFLETSRMKEGLFKIPILEYVKAPTSSGLREIRYSVAGLPVPPVTPASNVSEGC